jgi:2-keto-4-pentenoate hydratase/2-oxohepta-3-ene-1,7-dioic acid hydratase in catechol pathway
MLAMSRRLDGLPARPKRRLECGVTAMRLVTIQPESGQTADPWGFRVAVVLPSASLLPVVALARLTPDVLSEEIDGLDLARIMSLDPTGEVIKRALARVSDAALNEEAIDPATVRLAAPIPRPGKIVGVGNNYLEHLREQGLDKPTRPTLFSKFSNSVVGDGAPIRRPAGTNALDLEAELAVVIGRRATRVSAADGLAYVAGYCVANDVTARDWQGKTDVAGDGQWFRAKGSDTFLPLGPALVTADGRDGRGLKIRSWLTKASGPSAGQEMLMQDGDTSDLLVGVGELVGLISAEITLEPGDIIITGTPSGVGISRKPPIFMEPGDVVRVEIEGIGSLTNPVVDAAGRAPDGSPAARFEAEAVPA